MFEVSSYSLTCQPACFEDKMITDVDNAQDFVCSSKLMKAPKLSVCVCMCTCFAGKGSDEIQADVHAGRAAAHRSGGGE